MADYASWQHSVATEMRTVDASSAAVTPRKRARTSGKVLSITPPKAKASPLGSSAGGSSAEVLYLKAELPTCFEGLNPEETMALTSAIDAMSPEDPVLALTWDSAVFAARAPAGQTPLTVADDIRAHGATHVWGASVCSASFIFPTPEAVEECRQWLQDNHLWMFGVNATVSAGMGIPQRPSAAVSVVQISSVSSGRATVNGKFSSFLTL